MLFQNFQQNVVARLKNFNFQTCSNDHLEVEPKSNTDTLV